MGRSNCDKPFYVDVGTSIVAIRCASNHDVIAEYDYGIHPPVLQLAEEICTRMNKEAEVGKPLRNCDVGTAEEQLKRFKDFCRTISKDETCDGCLLLTQSSRLGHCVLDWAQMPYETVKTNNKGE